MRIGKFRRLYRAPFPKSGPARSEPVKPESVEPEPEPQAIEWPKDRIGELAGLSAALRTKAQ